MDKKTIIMRLRVLLSVLSLHIELDCRDNEKLDDFTKQCNDIFQHVYDNTLSIQDADRVISIIEVIMINRTTNLLH